MTENTGIHGSIPLAAAKFGPMTVDDERDLTQYFYDVI